MDSSQAIPQGYERIPQHYPPQSEPEQAAQDAGEKGFPRSDRRRIRTSSEEAIQRMVLDSLLNIKRPSTN